MRKKELQARAETERLNAQFYLQKLEEALSELSEALKDEPTGQALRDLAEGYIARDLGQLASSTMAWSNYARIASELPE